MTSAHGNPSEERSPEASASPPPRSKPAPNGCLRAHAEQARSRPRPDRIRTGGPETTGSPPLRGARALQARFQDRGREALRGEPARADDPFHDGAARAEPIVLTAPRERSRSTKREFPGGHGAMPGRLGEPRGASLGERRTRTAHAERDRTREGVGLPDGAETERELRSGSGSDPRNPEGGADVDRRGWMPSRRSASPARRRSQIPGLDQPAGSFDDGTAAPPPSDAATEARATATDDRATDRRRSEPTTPPAEAGEDRARA